MLQLVTHRQKDVTISSYNPSERRYKKLHSVKNMLQVDTHRQKRDRSSYTPSKTRYKWLHTLKNTLQGVRHREKMFQVDTHRLVRKTLQGVTHRQKDVICS